MAMVTAVVMAIARMMAMAMGMVPRWRWQSGNARCSGGRLRRRTKTGWTMTEAIDDKNMQDQVADYNGEGTKVASSNRDSGVVMMAATVEDGGGRQ